MSDSKKAAVWFEVNTPTREQTTAYYADLFGWETSVTDMGMGPYPMFHTQSTPFAGLITMTSPEWDGIPPHWMTYFRTEDIDAACAKATGLGATLHYGPFEIPTGRIAVLADPQGATFSLMQTKDPAEDPAPDAPSGVNWVEHMGPDAKAAIAFYQDLFGWERQTEYMGPEVGDYHMAHSGDTFHCGFMDLPPDHDVPPNWFLYFHTPDIQTTAQKVTGLGGTLVQPPFAIPQVGQIAVCADPAGAHFGLHQPEAKNN